MAVKEQVAVDPAVAKLLEEVAAPVETTAPLFTPAPAALFTPAPAALFTPSVAKGGLALSSKGGLTLSGPGLQLTSKAAASLFAPKRLNRKRIEVRRFVMPPPRPLPKKNLHWLSWCTFMEQFRDEDPRDRWRYWERGEGWNFDGVAAEAALVCAADMYESGVDELGPGHFITEEDTEVCEGDHHLSATPARDVEDTLTPCYHDWVDYEQEWRELISYFQEARDLALGNPETYIDRAKYLSEFLRAAGWMRIDIPFDRDRCRETILQAVYEDSHEEGLAACWADEMALHVPEAFGPLGKEISRKLDAIKAYNGIQPVPEPVLVFPSMHQPVDYQETYSGQLYPVVNGIYGIEDVRYYSALTRDVIVDGFLGWRVLFMIPLESAEEVVALGEPTDPAAHCLMCAFNPGLCSEHC